MTKRYFQRKSFWLMIFCEVFLIWLWDYSHKWHTFIEYNTPIGGVYAMARVGGIYFEIVPNGPYYLATKGLDYARIEADPKRTGPLRNINYGPPTISIPSLMILLAATYFIGIKVVTVLHQRHKIPCIDA